MADDNLSFSDDEPLSLKPEPSAPTPPPAGADEEEPLSLVDSDSDGSGASLKAFGAGLGSARRQQQYVRSLNLDGAGATRCRIFHSKIAESSLEYMQDQINGWLDSEEIEAKHVGHVMGTMEGKVAIPSVIVMVWY